MEGCAFSVLRLLSEKVLLVSALSETDREREREWQQKIVIDNPMG